MYLKFTADSIFTGTTTITNKVLIVNENKTIEAIVDLNDAGDDVQKFKGIISPGFINCHCHLELSHLKAIIPQHTGMVDFIFNILSKRNIDIEIIENAIETAEREMINNGIVAVGDICNTTHTIKQKQKNNLYYHNFIEISGFVPNTAQARLNAGLQVYNEFENFLPNASNTIVPHAPYSVSKELFCLIQQQSQNKISTIHNQESVDEIDFFANKTGDFLRLHQSLGIDISFFNPKYKSVLEYYIENMQNSSNCILVHNTLSNNSDLEILHKHSGNTQFYLCLCVIANGYINNYTPNLRTLFNNIQNIVVGTDSLASNNCLNILQELQTIKKLCNTVTIEQLLQMATINGARALGIDKHFGSFEKGKKSGVVLIEDFETQKQPKPLV